MSQEDLAQTAGLSLRTISDLERGKVARPRPSTIGRLAEALRLTPSQLQALIDCIYLPNN